MASAHKETETVSRFKGNAELKNPFRATIVEGHNRNKIALEHIIGTLKDNFTESILKIFKTSVLDFTSKEDSDDDNTEPKKLDFKDIEKQINDTIQEQFIHKFYKKFVPHLERNRNIFLNKFLMLQHSYAMNSFIDEISDNDITSINNFLDDDDTLIDKYEKAETMQEIKELNLLHSFLNNNDDDNDDSINLPSFMNGMDDMEGMDGMDDMDGMDGMDEDEDHMNMYNDDIPESPVCDSDDGENNGQDDPPIDYEDYFKRFLNNGLTDEINLDDDNCDDDDVNGCCKDECGCGDEPKVETSKPKLVSKSKGKLKSKKVNYTKEKLEIMKKDEIKEIAKSNSIPLKKSKKEKTKVQLINDILKLSK